MNQIQQNKATNYVQFDNDIIVDTLTGLPIGASQSGFARIVNRPRTSVQDWIKTLLPEIELLSLEIHTSVGLRRAEILPFTVFKQGFKKFNPDLLEAASDYGIAAYTLNLAGYKPTENLPELPVRDERRDTMEAYLRAAKLLSLEIAVQDLPGQKAINDKLIKGVSSQLSLPGNTDWVTAKQYLELIEFDMERKDLWNFSRACTNIYRLIYQTEPPKFKNKFVYPTTLFIYFETWIDGLTAG